MAHPTTRGERRHTTAVKQKRGRNLPEHVCQGNFRSKEYIACPICYGQRYGWRKCHYIDWYKDTEYRNCKEQLLVQSGVWAEVYEELGI